MKKIIVNIPQGNRIIVKYNIISSSKIQVNLWLSQGPAWLELEVGKKTYVYESTNKS